MEQTTGVRLRGARVEADGPEGVVALLQDVDLDLLSLIHI